MFFSVEQKSIINLLQEGFALSLSQISRKLNIGKSSLHYQIIKLCELGVLQKQKKSPKLITYTVADTQTLDGFIRAQKFALENVLKPKKMEGLEAYIDLLDKVASGKGNILGYSNLERKLLPHFKQHVFAYRERVARGNRTDRFIVPDTTTNVELVHEHFANTNWREHFKARFIPQHLINVNSDMYVWDDTVGICSFDGDKLHVEIYKDSSMFELYSKFLEVLWGISLEESVYFGPRTSELTAVEKEVYLGSGTILNLADGYPNGINLDWIVDYQMNRQQNDFLQTNVKTYISKITSYFEQLLDVHNITLTPASTYAFVIAADVLIETPGDEIIVLDPGFDSYPNIIRSFGGNVVYASRNKSMGPDLEEIRSKCGKRTKAIVICVPENPLGNIYSATDIEKLTKLCIEKQIVLVIDYCFKEIAPFEVEVPSLNITNDRQQSLQYVLIGDTGKILGLQGSKFGCLAYSNHFVEKINNKVNVYFFQLNHYDLYLLASILSDKRFGQYLIGLNMLVRKNYDYIKQNINRKIQVMDLDGSSVCLLDISQLGRRDTAVADLLRAQYHLGVVPVSYFYSGFMGVQYNYLRVALARPTEDVARGTEIINRMTDELS